MVAHTLTYLFRTVDTRVTAGTVTVVPSLSITILHADASVQADVRVHLARIGLGAVLPAHTFLTVASAKNGQLISTFRVTSTWRHCGIPT